MDVVQKEKTKAKQRYLKRKKQTRKQNKKKNAVTEQKRATGSDDEGENDAVEEETPMEVDLEVPKPTEKPRKKRRKIVDEEEEAEAEQEQRHDNPMQVDEEDVPDVPGALPSFPLPVHPSLPSRSDLALQGLDKSLADAEFVEPATVIDIPADGTENGGTGLEERTRKRLHELGITQLFAVQTALLPFLLPSNRLQRSVYRPYDVPQDVCVSAPTGSGKTLAYVLPIVEILSARIVTRLRALIVLPTRDLVLQVRETFEAIARGRGLKIGTATGQHSFSHEQSQLIADKNTHLQGGSSKVDILICTPGRLIDHLSGTPNFSLQHLRFLVIDEADRLLAQSFQDWLAQVLAATRPPATNAFDAFALNPSDSLAPAFHPYSHPSLSAELWVPEQPQSSCQKLLFSATLTRDPSKLAALDLHNPKYLVVRSKTTSTNGILDLAMEKFALPDTLQQQMIVVNASEKPLVFFWLIHNKGVRNALVFTKSAESTSRLVQLLRFFGDCRGNIEDQVVVHAYSSDLSPSDRKMVLEKFKKQEINILVASDLISRGIDISHVSHVVSYDVPVDMTKYVHRVGRTARAGRDGSAWSLVEDQEARYFKNMLKEAGHLENVKRVRLGEKELEGLRPDYKRALAQLKESYTRS
ncbi:DEAD-domain-containing protein, partial [Cylindrobasidium torrendii FP15055 ss-10]